ncbi:hypothetical protein HK100_003521 [Physocladia obscura]|uniref:2'-5'-oligoadenylate synthetase 1 domain-containing protein n=1 Tax=Physocladia obscura TaxID=109957 RepID=A0AAD5T7Q4_9FUNG|nr:hypothetical protein HK100_003521 [Physocladia obscura]
MEDSQSSNAINEILPPQVNSTQKKNQEIISWLSEIAQGSNAVLTEMYSAAGSGEFKCHFMWNALRLPSSEIFPRKKDAKSQAAQLALDYVLNAHIESVHIPPHLLKKIIPTRVGVSSSQNIDSSATLQQVPLFDTRMVANLPIEQSQAQPVESFVIVPPLCSQTNPMTDLQVYVKKNSIAIKNYFKQLGSVNTFLTISYNEISSPTEFKFSVSLDSHVLSQSDGFPKKILAKRHAAEQALEELKSIVEDGNNKGIKRRKFGSSIESVASPSSVDIVVHETDVHSVRPKPPSTLVLLQNSSAAVNLSMQSFYELVSSALKSSPINASIETILPLAKNSGLEVWYKGIQSLKLTILEGKDFMDEKDFMKPELASRVQQSLRHSCALIEMRKQILKIRESGEGESGGYVSGSGGGCGISQALIESWEPNYSESTHLFFKNHQLEHRTTGKVARVLKFWATTALAFLDAKAFAQVMNVLDFVAVWAYDTMERSVNFESSRLSAFASFELTLKTLENWKNMKIFWTELYPRTEIQDFLNQNGDKPFILHPANPFCNLFESVSISEWSRIGDSAKEARILVEKATLGSQQLDFISEVLKPQLDLPNSFEISYCDIGTRIVRSKEQINYTNPDVQICFEPEELDHMDQECDTVPTQAYSSMEKIMRIIMAKLAYHSNNFSMSNAPISPQLSDAALQLADIVSKETQNCVKIVGGGQISLSGGDNFGKALTGASDGVIGSLMWPVVGGRSIVCFRVHVRE